MNQLLPEAKVTIIVEGMSDITMFTIPLASDVTYSKYPSVYLTDGMPAEKRFAMSCYALYDIDQNQDVVKQTLSNTELENWIIDRANKILQDRDEKE